MKIYPIPKIKNKAALKNNDLAIRTVGALVNGFKKKHLQMET